MFEVGFSELLLIMGLALLVLGPEKLPKVVGEIGRWMGRARAMARQFREQLEEESLENTRRRQEREAAATPASAAPPAAASAAATSSADVPAAAESATATPEPPPFMDATGTVDDYLTPHSAPPQADTPAHHDTAAPTEAPAQDERRA